MKKSELMREEFSKRLKKALAINSKDGWGSGSYLKEITGVTQKAANKWLNAESIPNKEKLDLISKQLGVSPSWLAYGEGEISPLSNKPSYNQHNNIKVVESYIPSAKPFSYPIVTWHDAEKFIDKRLSSNQYRGALMSSINIKSGFWIEVTGDAMWSSGRITFPNGSMILIDPDYEKLESGKFYIVKFKDGTMTFKQLIRDAGMSYLKSLNDNYKPIPINENECEFLGLVVDRDLGKLY